MAAAAAADHHLDDDALRPLLLLHGGGGGNNKNGGDGADRTTPHHDSSRLPTAQELLRILAGAAVCAVACVAAAWLTAFLCLCVLLSRANTPEVRTACPGLWDFMLAALLAPLAIPCLYCAVACCLWVPWQPFYGACSLVMAVACLHMALTASESGACVEALRRTSEPLPWLLYAAYIKGGLFAAAAVSSLLSPHNPSPAATTAAAVRP
jgi:hypothetical protein